VLKQEKKQTNKNLAEKSHSEIILEWIFGKQGGRVWTGSIWLRIGTSGSIL